MTEDQELFTDLSLQLFNSFLSGDISSMKQLLESFKSYNEEYDFIFLPGLLYGLMYHMSVFVSMLEESHSMDKENIMSDYGIEYAVTREKLLSNPLLHPKKALEKVYEMMDMMEKFEKIFNDNE